MSTRQIIVISALALLLLPCTPSRAQVTDLPTPVIVAPQNVVWQTASVSLSPSPNFHVARDYGEYTGIVTRYRTLLQPGLLPLGNYADSRLDFENNVEHLAGFADEDWGPWQDWPAGVEEIRVAYYDLPEFDQDDERINYIFAVQVMGDDGAVSLLRDYGIQVANFRVSSGLAPLVLIEHRLLGSWTAQGPYGQANLDVMRDVPGLFTWTANAGDYGGYVISSRWGWDLQDPDDENDPGWQVPPGMAPENFEAGPIPFASGIHTLTIQVDDAGGGRTRWVALVNLVPIPDPADQWPLLLVDDVVDQSSNGWLAEDGTPLDRDMYRDAFWTDVLAGAGGVAGFDPDQHVIDAENAQVTVRDLVASRVVIWHARWASAPATAIAGQFRPLPDNQLRYVWLGSYQEQAGNLLLCGERATGAFLEDSPYVMPVIFESGEGDDWRGYEYRGWNYVRTGFGFFQGTTEQVYPWLYGYRNLGLAAQDVTAPTTDRLRTPWGESVNLFRKAPCAGLKGVVLDADFATAYGTAGAFPDTIWTEPAIAWRDDPVPDQGDPLTQLFIWGDDEFYEADIIDRNIPWQNQQCDDDGDCMVPMLRTAARFDWVRHQRQLIDPDDPWPEGYYGGPYQPELDDVCGIYGLDLDHTSARTNDTVCAFLTNKHRLQKPSERGDVVMGFDPYRLDHAAMRQMLQWVLGEHFGLSMLP